jgi:hypothetical protein
MQVATIPHSPSGPAFQPAAAASSSPGPIATFVSLLSLLLGTTTAAEQPAQESTAEAADGAVSAGSDGKGGVRESESQPAKFQEKAISNGVLIGHFLLPGCPPAALPSGIPGAPKETHPTESSARHCGRKQEKSHTDAEQATTAPVVPIAMGATPAGAALAAPAPAEMAPAPPPERPGASPNAAGPLDPSSVHVTSPLVPTPSDARLAKTPEPPVAFVLELKPAAQGLPAPTQPAAAAKGASRDMALEADAPPSTGARVSAPLAKPDAQTGNQQKNWTDGERDRQNALEDMRPRREVTPSGDAKSIETILKPAGVAPVSEIQRPTMPGESFTRADPPAEPAARANAVAPPEQPKPAAVREISFQSASPEAGSVKVQLIDRGGDIRISVRSSDPNFTHALQRDVGQLVTKLDHAGYETKVWNPRDASPLTAATGVRDIEIRPDAGAGNSASPDPGSQGGQGGGQEHAQQQRRHGDPRQWADALNETARRAITDDEEDKWQ